MELIEKIMTAAQNKRLSQSALEIAAALAKGRISKWKNGQGDPSFDEVVRLSRVLQLPLEFLADDQADEAPAPPEPESPTWLAVRAIAKELGEEEAVRRLLRPPGPVFGDVTEGHGESRIGPRRGAG